MRRRSRRRRSDWRTRRTGGFSSNFIPLFAEPIQAGPGSIACGKSSSPGGRRSRHVEERLQRGPSEGFPIVCVLCPRAARRNHESEGAGEVPRASSNYDEFLHRIGGQSAQRFLSPMLKNECNRLTEVRQAFFPRLALTVGARHLGAVRDVPWAVLLDDRGELVAHVYILPPAPPRRRPAPFNPTPQLLPRAEGIGIRGGAVAQPGVELRGLFQLLAALARHRDEAAVQFRKRGHIAP